MTLKLACNQAPVDVNYLLAKVKVVGDIIRTLRVLFDDLPPNDLLA